MGVAKQTICTTAMADDELDALRAKRLAELQAQYGGKVGKILWSGSERIQLIHSSPIFPPPPPSSPSPLSLSLHRVCRHSLVGRRLSGKDKLR